MVALIGLLPAMGELVSFQVAFLSWLSRCSPYGRIERASPRYGCAGVFSGCLL